jgi:cytochrome c biogenesis protein
MSKQETKQPTAGIVVVITKRLWQFFSSVRLALVLILVIAGMSLLDAFTSIAVIGSIYFAIPAIMLMVNIFVCSLNRWKILKTILRGPEIVHSDTFYQSGITIKNITLSYSETGGVIGKILEGKGYRLKNATGDGAYIAADKNRYFRLGTYLTHFSLILFVAAFLWGARFGFQDTSFTVNEGETREVGHGTGLSLKLVSFVYEQYENGMPKDYRSQVILYDNGQPAREALIRVNHPLYYKGIRFYQSYFGTGAANIQIRNESGDNIYSGSVSVSEIPEYPQYFLGRLDLPEQGFSVIVMAPAAPDDPMIPGGYLGIGIIRNGQEIGPDLVPQGVPTLIDSLEFTFGGMLPFSGFQVNRDPANAFIWIASALFLIGLCSVFYFPLRQVWAVSREEEHGSTLSVQMLSRPSFNTAAVLKDLEKEIKTQLPVLTGKQK